MQIELSELTALLSRLTPPAAVSEPASSPVRDMGTQIVVADRGFVYVGKVVVDAQSATITNARNIRKWGTTNGLGELVSGPTKDTVLDPVGEVVVPMRAVIHFIKCTRDW